MSAISVSIYSVIMATIWFSVAVLIDSYILRRVAKHGLLFVAVISFLSVLRIFLPLDLDHSLIIRSVRLYPFLQTLMRTRLVGQITIGSFLIICWAVGVSVCLALLLRKLMHQRRFCKVTCTRGETDCKLLELFCDVGSEMKYNGPISLTVAANATTAYQAGFIHPHIILPHNIDTFTVEDVRNMLRHELCHFLGGDLWIKISFQILACILWWNPIVIILGQNVEQMLELRCDRRVCEHLTEMEQISYLDTLLRLLSYNYPNISGISMEYSGYIEETKVVQRFQMVLQGTTQRVPKIKSAIGYLLCIVLFLASYCITLQPWVPSPATSEAGAKFEESDVVIEASYIVCESDGTLHFYCNGIYLGDIPENTLHTAPFNELPIICK